MSILDDVKIPSYGPQGGQTPAAPAPTPAKSIFDAVKIPDYSKPAPGSVFNNVKVTSPSPYFSTTTPSGASIGFSDQKDFSGTPFLAFRNPGDTATTTDKTRVATTFDPTAPQKLDPKTFLNARMSSGAASKLKEIMGGSYSDELDHKIALELAGSNDSANLQIQSGRTNGGDAAQSDTVENSLARDVATGKTSLFEAQTKLAEQKGLPTPWTGATKQGFFDKVKSFFGGLMGGSKPQSTAAPTPPIVKPEAEGDTMQKRIDTLNGGFTALDRAKSNLDLNDPAAVKVYNNRLELLNSQKDQLGKDIEDFNTRQQTDQMGTAGSSTFAPKPAGDTASTTPQRADIMPGSTEAATRNAAGKTAIGKGLDFLFNPKAETPAPTIPFFTADEQAPAFVGPRIVTWPIKGVSEMLSQVIQAIPRAAITLQQEFNPKTYGTSATTQLSPLETRLYGNPQYKNINADIQDRIKNGDGILSSYIGGISGKTLDVAFGASVLASGLRFLAASLVKNNPNALIESWKTLGSPKDETELNQNYRQLANQLHPDKTGGDGSAIAVINKAKEMVDEKGIPTLVTLAKNDASRYAEWAGRETNLGQPIFTPNISVKSGVNPAALPLQALPGYRAQNQELKPIGLSTEPVEPVGFGGKEKPAEASSKEQQTPEFKGFQDVTTSILDKLQGRSTVSAQFISDLTNNESIKKPEQLIIRQLLSDYPADKPIPVAEFANKVKAELLPLSRSTVGSGPDFEDNPSPHESTTLPPEIRGNVAKYSEHVYESPIKTGGSSNHYSTVDHPNYFGHTRVEDVPGKTRRIIEVQSDLYQKGRIENEARAADIKKTGNEKSAFSSTLEKTESAKRAADIAKLQQYSNPTAHFRMVREEIKQAAIDGKTKLQFPTGETAMKIEGLGENNPWKEVVGNSSGVDLKPENLKVGMKITGEDLEDLGNKDTWLVTDVLGDGKFNAVQEDKLKNVTGETIAAKLRSHSLINYIETFDISGKVDTSNPIYRFYEKDLGRYLTNKYGAKVVTDKQGVKWYELDIPKEAAKQPVTAFKVNAKYQGYGPLVPFKELKGALDQYLTKNGVNPRAVKFFLDPDLIKNKGAVGYYVQNGWKSLLTNEVKGVLALFEKGGKVYSRIAFHEGTHAILEAYKESNPTLYDTMIKEALDQMTPAHHTYYSARKNKDGTPAYSTEEDRAQEFISDEEGKYQSDKLGYKSKIQRVLEALHKFMQSIIDAAKGMYAHLKSIPNQQGGSINFGADMFGEEIPPASERLGNLQTTQGASEDYIKNSPEKKLWDIVRPSVKVIEGAKPHLETSLAQLRETSPRLKNLDDKVTELGFKNLDEATSRLDRFLQAKQQYDASVNDAKGLRKQARAEKLEEQSPEALKQQAMQELNFEGNSEEKKAWSDIMHTTLSVSEVPPDEIKSIKQVIAGRISKEAADTLEEFIKQNPEMAGPHPDIDAWLDNKDGEFSPVEEYMKSVQEETENDKTTNALIDAASTRSREAILQQKIADFKAETGVTLSPDVIEANSGVVPPSVRGGLRAPEIDWSKLKPISAVRMTRETMERNIEKQLKEGALSGKINNFYIEKIRKNETERVNYVSSKRLKVRQRAKDLGLREGSKADRAAVAYMEGKLPLAEFRSIAGKSTDAYIKMAAFIQNEYGHDLNDTWNPARAKYGYKPVPVHKNYFRHGYQMANEWLGAAGVLRDLLLEPSELPGEIAGLTENFKPGKQFASPELRRVGEGNSLGLLQGYDKYLDAFSTQAFHIDSIQRGRAIEKYARQVSRSRRLAGKPLNLNNFVSNLTEHVNLVAGKSSVLDRAVEGFAGRNLVRAIGKLTQIESANIIAGNISSAITHTIPTVLSLATTAKVPFTIGLLDTLRTPFSKDPFSVGGIRSDFLTRRYPVEYIQPTNFKKVGNVLGFPFRAADLFISQTALRGKFYEGLQKGLTPEQAMKRADNYAMRVVGDRSRGNLPNLMSAKTLAWITRFQIEINDNLSVLVHDIPRWSSESITAAGEKVTDFEEVTSKNTGEKVWVKKSDTQNYYKVASMLVQFVIFVHLYNWLTKKIKGTGKGFDPISIGLHMAGFNDDDIPFIPQKSSSGSIGKDVAAGLTEAGGELPFSSALSGQYPVIDTIPNPINILKNPTSPSTYATEFGKPVYGLASPVGGGLQSKKTVQGLEAYSSGSIKKGKGTEKIPQTPTNFIKGALFGPSAMVHEPIKPPSAAASILAKYGIKSSTPSAAKSILDKYGIK